MCIYLYVKIRCRRKSRGYLPSSEVQEVSAMLTEYLWYINVISFETGEQNCLAHSERCHRNGCCKYWLTELCTNS